MAKRALRSTHWLSLTVDKLLADLLEAHRRRLSRERGVEVTRSDAMRDAILRTKGAAS